MYTSIRFRRLVFVGCCLLVVAGVYLTGGYPFSPCQDRLSFSGYDVEMDVSYDAQAGTVSVEHSSGPTLPADRTESVSVVVLTETAPGQRTETTAYVLANTTAAFPIAPGRGFQLGNATFDNESVSAGDGLAVVLNSTQRPLRWYCRNSRTDATLEYTVGRTTV